jgi:hypothetical protein
MENIECGDSCNFNDLPFDLHKKKYNMVTEDEEKIDNCKRWYNNMGLIFFVKSQFTRIPSMMLIFKYHTVFYKVGDIAYFSKKEQCKIIKMTKKHIIFENTTRLNHDAFYGVNKFDDFQTPDCWQRFQRKKFWNYKKND